MLLHWIRLSVLYAILSWHLSILSRKMLSHGKVKRRKAFRDYRALFQYLIRHLVVRCHKVSKPPDLYLELCDHSENWQTPLQYCCRCACQISKWWDNFNYKSRSFETSRDFVIRRLIGYWNRDHVMKQHNAKSQLSSNPTLWWGKHLKWKENYLE